MNDDYRICKLSAGGCAISISSLLGQRLRALKKTKEAHREDDEEEKEEEE